MSNADAAVSKLRSVPGVVDVWPLPDPERTVVLRLEEEACNAAGFSGWELANDGIKVVLSRDFVLAINHSSNLRHPSGPLLFLALGNEVVGEEVWRDEQVAQYKENPEMIFLGSGFVLFRDKLEKARGKRLKLILGPQSFPELESVSGICQVVSATISRNTDIYIKTRAKWGTTNLDNGTVLIGFNSRPAINP